MPQLLEPKENLAQELAPKKITHPFVRAQAKFIYDHGAWVLAGIILLAVLLFPFAKRINLHANFLDLLSSRNPSVINLKELTSHVGGTSFMILVFESPDEETARLVSERFAGKAAKFNDVEYIDNRTSIPAFQSRKLLFLDLESVKNLEKNVRDVIGHYRRKNNPFFVDLLNEAAPTIDLSSLKLEQKLYRIGGFSSKEKETYMQVSLVKPKHPVSDFVRSKRLFQDSYAAFDEIKKDFKSPVTMGITGPYRTRYNEYKTITRDLGWTGVVTVVLITLIIIAAFRNFRSLLYTFVPLGIGILFTCAAVHFLIGYLNLITALLLSILTGMAIDYVIHFLVSFEEDLKETGDTYLAIEQTYLEIWEPLLTSCLTTAVAFFSMTISQFEGFRHFGVIAGVGILISFVVIFYGLPALLAVGERYFPPRRPVKEKQSNILPSRFINVIIIAGVLFSIYSLTQVPHLRFSYNFRDLQEKADDAIDLGERIGKYFDVRLNPVIFMTPDRARAKAFADELNRYAETHPETSVDFAAALPQHVPGRQEEKIAVLRSMDALLARHDPVIQKLDGDLKKQVTELKEQLKATPLGVEDLPRRLVEQYEGTDHKISAVFVYPSTDLLDGARAQEFVKELRGLKTHADIRLAGEPVIYSDILTLLQQDAPRSIGLSFLIVVILLFLHFKRPGHVFWVLSPVLLGFLWIAGMAALTKFKFNFFNIAILPSIVGVGVDNGIYIFHRYKEETREEFFSSFQKTAKGVILSSVTTIAAFAAIYLAKHIGTSSMGQLGVLGYTAGLLTSVFFIPAVIEFMEIHRRTFFRRKTRP